MSEQSEQKNTPPLYSEDGLPWPSSDAELLEQYLILEKRYARTNLTGKELEALIRSYPINHGQDIDAWKQPADYKKMIKDMMRPLPPMGG